MPVKRMVKWRLLRVGSNLRKYVCIYVYIYIYIMRESFLVPEPPLVSLGCLGAILDIFIICF